MTQEFSHLNEQGQANMVDVSAKHSTDRRAIAEGYVVVSPFTMQSLLDDSMEKGDVFATARIAGIQAAKKTADLIPLCHPLALSKVQIDFDLNEKLNQIRIQCMCKLNGRTGVEMEALIGVSVAALTLFDMCKAVDPTMIIEGIKVLKKEGGKTGDWQHPGLNL